MAQLELTLRPKAFNTILEDARRAYPNECCGFLYGIQGTERVVSEALSVRNTKEGDQRRRFEVSPRDYMRAEKYADDNGLQLLGVYHSHPDHPARPSEHDRKQAMPWFSYVIVSVDAGKPVDLRSWQLNRDAQFEEEHIPEQATLFQTEFKNIGKRA